MAINEDLQFYNMCLKAHGYTFLQDHVDGDNRDKDDVDGGKSESDEESRSMKPPPIPYSKFKHKIVKLPDVDADLSKIRKRENNFLNENMSKSKQISKVNDKVKKLTNNKAEVIQNTDLNKNNHINSKNTVDNPRTLIINAPQKENYGQCVEKLKVTRDTPFNGNSLLEKSENSMTQRLPSTAVVSPSIFDHDNITLPSNVINLSRTDRELKVKTTDTNRSATSKIFKTTGKTTMLKNVNINDESQIQITEMSKDYSWVEKRKSIPYPELPSTSRVPYNPFERIIAVESDKSTKGSAIENLRSGASKRESIPYPELPSISRVPYNPFKRDDIKAENYLEQNYKSTNASTIGNLRSETNKRESPPYPNLPSISRMQYNLYEYNSIKVGNNLEQNHRSTTGSAIENCSSGASKHESAPQPELISTSSMPYNPFGYDIPVEHYLSQNYKSNKERAVQHPLSADRDDHSQISIASKTEISKNNYSSQKENPSDVFGSIDSIFTRFQKKRKQINKKKRKPVCVVM